MKDYSQALLLSIWNRRSRWRLDKIRSNNNLTTLQICCLHPPARSSRSLRYCFSDLRVDFLTLMPFQHPVDFAPGKIAEIRKQIKRLGKRKPSGDSQTAFSFRQGVP